MLRVLPEMPAYDLVSFLAALVYRLHRGGAEEEGRAGRRAARCVLARHLAAAACSPAQQCPHSHAASVAKLVCRQGGGGEGGRGGGRSLPLRWGAAHVYHPRTHGPAHRDSTSTWHTFSCRCSDGIWCSRPACTAMIQAEQHSHEAGAHARARRGSRARGLHRRQRLLG